MAGTVLSSSLNPMRFFSPSFLETRTWAQRRVQRAGDWWSPDFQQVSLALELSFLSSAVSCILVGVEEEEQMNSRGRVDDHTLCWGDAEVSGSMPWGQGGQ